MKKTSDYTRFDKSLDCFFGLHDAASQVDNARSFATGLLTQPNFSCYPHFQASRLLDDHTVSFIREYETSNVGVSTAVMPRKSSPTLIESCDAGGVPFYSYVVAVCLLSRTWKFVVQRGGVVHWTEFIDELYMTQFRYTNSGTLYENDQLEEFLERITNV